MTHASTRSLDTLTGALRSHLRGSALPVPVHVQFDLTTEEVAVQLHDSRCRQALTDLLLWAGSLHAVTVKWWRTTTARLHITVRGSTTAGISVHVYTGLIWSEVAGLVLLAEGENAVVSLDELQRLADQLGTSAVAA
jgi:hypothetical protein